VASGTTHEPAASAGPRDETLAGVVAHLSEQLDELVESATGVIFAEIPAYHARDTPALRTDVAQHVREHFSKIMETFRIPREITREDVIFIRRHAAARVERISVADFIHAFHIGQRILWNATVALAQDDASRRAVLGLVAYIARYFDVATTHAAEVYLEAEELHAATGERMRRDVLEDLLAGVVAAAGRSLNALIEAGLEPSGRCLVISALPVAPIDDEHALRGAAGALARAPGRAVAPPTVIRHQEIVIVAPAREDGLVARVGEAQHRLAERGLPLAVGISTVHASLAEVPEAYGEAVAARNMLAPSAGVVALPEMSAFDYMVRRSDTTARRLIPEPIERFVTEDAAHGGVLLATLRAYAAADLSAKQAAEALHVHVNTAHYRLAKIEERTGANLRRVSDVIELLIAAQLVGAPSP
jgi:hypothetical protein